KFYNNPELPKQYPLLFHTLKSINNLEYVKYLTGIGQWTKHCHLQFSGIFTKKECKTKTITSIINDGNNAKYKIFWQQLVKCWNRFNDHTPGVSQLSQNPKDVHLDYCVLQTSTPGRLIVNIIEILQKINNNFLQSVHSYCRKAPMRKEQRTKNDSTTETKNAVSSNQTIVSKSLFEISNRDIVCVSNTMVNKIINTWHCPTLEYGHNYDDDSNERIDLQSIEDEIYNKAILGRHIIDLTIPMFQYADELTTESYLKSLENRYPDLKNHSSTSNEWESIQSIFSDPQDKQDAVQILCQVIVLLNRADKINLTESLCNWMKTMNFDQWQYELFKERAGVKMLVKHVSELWRALKGTKVEHIY
ncbi:hypothetical protein RFI_17282, partial [Reticulomyxa filosa]